MVANNDRGNQELRAHHLWKDVADCMQRGKRNPEGVARVLQVIKDNPQFSAKLFPPDHSAEAQLQSWQKRFGKLGIKLDVAKLRIPEKKEGFDRLIGVPQELRRPSAVIKILQKEMKVWTFTDLQDLDSQVSDIVPRPKGDYAIWVRDRQEADEELANKSAEMIQKEDLNTETLTERLLHELVYHEETGQHLDEKNVTLCSGSRCTDPDGSVGVPCVCWHSVFRGLDVYWYFLDDRGSCVRGRAAVS